jgi:5,6-dimethylbenzimidazole synthase
MSEHAYSDAERAAVYRAIAERRDMRHFAGGRWRRSCSPAGRRAPGAERRPDAAVAFHPHHPHRAARAIQALVEDERVRTAEALGERSDEFMKLKVEGINDCAEVLVAALMDNREPHIFGRRTLPEMDLASLACAIQNLWLAARAEGPGHGLGVAVRAAGAGRSAGLAAGAKPVAVLCLGPVTEFYPAPMLVLENWAEQRPLSEMLYENHWGDRQ